jgi:pilus assembly protein CpaF
MVADSVDMLVQIGIRHEKRCVTTIAKIARELRGGDVWFDPLWQYDETSQPGAPRWEKLAELEE